MNEKEIERLNNLLENKDSKLYLKIRYGIAMQRIIREREESSESIKKQEY